MKYLLTGEQMLLTEVIHFEVRKVSRISYKRMYIEFLDVFHIFELLLHLESNLAEIWKIASTDKGKKSGAFFF